MHSECTPVQKPPQGENGDQCNAVQSNRTTLHRAKGETDSKYKKRSTQPTHTIPNDTHHIHQSLLIFRHIKKYDSCRFRK